MPKLLHDAIEFNYCDEATGGKPLLFMHGLGGDLRQVTHLLSNLPNIRLISFDFRGHGHTYCANEEQHFSMLRYAQDAIALLDFLNIEKCFVGGNSLGAAIALLIAFIAPHRVEKLIFLRPAWLNQGIPENLILFYIIGESIERFGVEDAALMLRSTFIYKGLKQQYPHCETTILSQFDRFQAGDTPLLLKQLTLDKPFSTEEELLNITCPTLILVCKEDAFHPFEYGLILQDCMNNARLVEVPSRYVEPELYYTETETAISNFLHDVVPE